MTGFEMSEEEMLKRKYTRPYEKRIAELEDKLANADYQLEGRDLEIKELEKANAELNKQLEMSNKVYNDNLDYSHHIEEQLTKAKELIKKVSEFVNNGIEYDPEHPQEHTDLWNKLCEEAE